MNDTLPPPLTEDDILGAEHKQRADFQEAYAFLAAYTGTFDFLLDVQARVREGMTLSENQVAAVLRCKARERPPVKTDGLDLTVLPKGQRRYAVPNSEGKLTFLRIDNIEDEVDSGWNGWVFVHQFLGGQTFGERGPRLGKQRPGGRYEGQWESLLEKVLADPKEAMETFGKELGFCGYCGKTLTDPVSRAFGIGPICREGW